MSDDWSSKPDRPSAMSAIGGRRTTPWDDDVAVALPDHFAPQEHWVWDRIARGLWADLRFFPEEGGAWWDQVTADRDVPAARDPWRPHADDAPYWGATPDHDGQYLRRTLDVGRVAAHAAEIDDATLREFVSPEHDDSVYHAFEPSVQAAVNEAMANWSEETAAHVRETLAHMPRWTPAGTEVDVFEPIDPVKWPAWQTLSADFLRTITAFEPWCGARLRPWIRIRGARFDALVDFENDHVDAELGLWSCRFEADINLMGATATRILNFQGSCFAGKIVGDRLNAQSGLFLRDGAFIHGDVRLLGAHVAGSIEGTRSVFGATFLADGLTVEGSAFFDDGVKMGGPFRLAGGEVSGHLSCVGGAFLSAVSIAETEVTRTVSLVNASVSGDLLANDMEVGGNLQFGGLNVGGGLRADGTRVDGSMFLNSGARVEGETNVMGARVCQHLACNDGELVGLVMGDELVVEGSLYLRDGATLRNGGNFIRSRLGKLDISGSLIGGEINLSGGDLGDELTLCHFAGNEPRWLPDASLILRNARVHALQGAVEAWRTRDEEGGADPRATVARDLTGFSYQRLGGLGAKEKQTLAVASPGKLRAWLRAARDPSGDFTPSPYRQLADALRRDGREEKARKVLIALGDHERDCAPRFSARRLVLSLSHLLIGFGYRNWRALAAFLAVAVGFAVLGAVWDPSVHFNDESLTLAEARAWLGYSFDTALPFVDLDPERDNFLISRFGGTPPTWSRFMFAFERLLGLVVLSFALAGISGWAERRGE